MKQTRRGFVPTDKIEFSESACETLWQAGRDFYYLLNHGYPVKGASTFVGNHFSLSERQRLALVRSISSQENRLQRKVKEQTTKFDYGCVHIDGFNTIITLETALSHSLLLYCMDNTIRDLAGVRGTYRIIDKTETAILLILKQLEQWKIKQAVFYLDAPVSNSGNLKTVILQLSKQTPIEIEVMVTPQVDVILQTLPYVITSDAIILNRCISWINLTREILFQQIPDAWYIDFHSI